MICRYIDEGGYDRGPLAEDSATKLKRGQLYVFTVCVCVLYGVLFSPI
jgi:hypothetical protein